MAICSNKGGFVPVTYFVVLKQKTFVCGTLSISPFTSNLANQDHGKYHSQDLKRRDNMVNNIMTFHFKHHHSTMLARIFTKSHHIYRPFAF